MVTEAFNWSDEDLLPPRLAAVFLGGTAKPISLPTLALWRRQGTGPVFVSLHKSIRYPVSGLKAFQQTLLDKTNLDA